MSVLIKGLKMPENCEECFFYNGICAIEGSGNTEGNYNKRGDCCPLVELPTADELAEDMRTAAKNTDQEISHGMMDDVMCRILCEMGYEEAVAIFNDAPKWYA